MIKNLFRVELYMLGVFLLFISCIKKDKTNATESNVDEIVENIVNNMVLIEGGKFTMGCSFDDVNGILGAGNVAHEVALPSFYLCKFEVSQQEWETIMGNNPSPEKGEKLPVSNISWNDCVLFINELNSLSNKKFRLPTEAEWEYAALGGRKSRMFIYSGSNNLNKIAWHRDNTKSFQEVGTKEPNELGLFDMCGNVREWCHDYFSDEYYGEDFVYDPQGPTEKESYDNGHGDMHVVRGGSVWRGWYEVKARDACGMKEIEDIGFRLALSL